MVYFGMRLFSFTRGQVSKIDAYTLVIGYLFGRLIGYIGRMFFVGTMFLSTLLGSCTILRLICFLGGVIGLLFIVLTLCARDINSLAVSFGYIQVIVLQRNARLYEGLNNVRTGGVVCWGDINCAIEGVIRYTRLVYRKITCTRRNINGDRAYRDDNVTRLFAYCEIVKTIVVYSQGVFGCRLGDTGYGAINMVNDRCQDVDLGTIYGNISA